MHEGPLPIVLSGGRSRRFGRDKLREPIAGTGGVTDESILIDAPLRALREVFGPPVALAGACAPEVAARADLIIHDVHPGCGPIGGIISALEHALARRGVFVLAGDLLTITAAEVRLIRDAAELDPGAWAVLADSGIVEPCVGVYRASAIGMLREHLAAGRRSLHDALPAERIRRVPIDPSRVRNVNVPSDLDMGPAVSPRGAPIS